MTRSIKDREAWTAFVEGRDAKQNKYGVSDKERRGKYASAHEAQEAAKLAALERSGKIQDLREQVSFVLVPGYGKIRPIRYVADFVWMENGREIVADAKGCKTPLYRLKRKMMQLLLGIEIVEL